MLIPESCRSDNGLNDLTDGDDLDPTDHVKRVARAHEYIREVGKDAMLEALRELGELESDSMVYDWQGGE